MNDPVSAELLRHFFRISRHLAGHLDFSSAIAAVADEIAIFLPYDHLDVCMVQPDGAITGAYESGLQTAWAHSHSTPPEQSPIRALLLREVDHILTADAVNDPRFNFPGAYCGPIIEHGLRARIHVPLIVKGELIGALSISSQTAGRYGPHEVRQARYVADLLSPYFFAIQAAEQARQSALTEAQARRREEALRIGALELTQFLEHERQRIGMDLHDQTLADLTRLIRDIRQGAMPGEQVLGRLQDCAEELRRIIDMAAPTLLEMFGFTHAVRIHLERAAQTCPFLEVTDTAGSLPDDLPAMTRVALFRITQEAINNAALHAKAGRITVELGAEGTGLRVVIRDNGRGLPKRRPPRLSGGLAHMRTRARLISADFTVESSPQGTCITLFLPDVAQAAPWMSQAGEAR